MKKTLFIVSLLWGGCSSLPLLAQRIMYQTCPQSGAIAKLGVSGDERAMNWLTATDGSQYEWITERHGWGLGYFTEITEGVETLRRWEHPTQTDDNGNTSYETGPIRIDVKRSMSGNDLCEQFIFTNQGEKEVTLADMGIHTPFNDNYPDSRTCIEGRANVHIWAGGHAAYVNAMNMGGKAPHIGLVLKEGSLSGYEISERAGHKGWSNNRGVISLNLPDLTLKPGESSTLEWTLFSHTGENDFRKVKSEFYDPYANDQDWALVYYLLVNNGL